jgi:hypothetical protein
LCRVCDRLKNKDYYKRNPERAAEYRRAAREDGRSRSYHLSRYGMTVKDYDDLYDQQGGLCKLCLCKSKLVVDHCHLTGRVRGLLCTKCNTGLGKFNDDIDMLKKAINYLK